LIATKAWVRDQLRELTDNHSTASLLTPAALGDQLTLVTEDASASVRALGTHDSARHDRVFAEVLIDSATA
jgi:hypothetical protein